MPDAEEPTDLEVVIHGMADEPEPFHIPVDDEADEPRDGSTDEPREVEVELPEEVTATGPAVFEVDDGVEVDPTHPPVEPTSAAEDPFAGDVSDDFDLDSLEAAVAELGLDDVQVHGRTVHDAPPPPPGELTPPPPPPVDHAATPPPPPPVEPDHDAAPPPPAGPEAHAAPPPPAPPSSDQAQDRSEGDHDDAAPDPPQRVDVANFTAHRGSRKRGLFGR